MSIGDTLRELGSMGLGAGAFMWLLAALGAIAVVVAVDRGLVLVRTYDDVTRLRLDLARALGRGDLTEARTCAVASRSIEARIVAAGLGALPRGAAAVEERMASEALSARLSLERRLIVLRTIASSAPLLGLLGAVVGMIRALVTPDGVEGEDWTSSADLPEALTAAAAGLLVALAASVFVRVIQHQIATRMACAETLGREMLSYVKDERRSLAKEAAVIPGGWGSGPVGEKPSTRARWVVLTGDDGPDRATQGAT